MQTFVPYETFNEIARCLDYRRLGKQRVECLQILNALATGEGWINHPATRMWEGYEAALRRYQAVMIQEWIRRGYRNTMKIPRSGGRLRMPYWWGDSRVHSSHRAALLYKDPVWYDQFNWTEAPRQDYYWPRRDE